MAEGKGTRGRSGGGSFRTICAKHPGKCRRCDGAITPGMPIRWAPGAGSYHMADQCGQDAADSFSAELEAAKRGAATYVDALGRELEVSDAARELAREELIETAF